MQAQFLTVKQVAAIFNVSPACIWNWTNPKNSRYIAAFPKPCKLSKSITRWKTSEIQAHIDSLSAAKE